MVTKEAMSRWLEKKQFALANGKFMERGAVRYELAADHYRKLQRDKAKQWHLMEVVSYVDLFEQADGEVVNKWHHVIGKQLSSYFR